MQTETPAGQGPAERMVRPGAEARDTAPGDEIGRAALLVLSPEVLAELHEQRVYLRTTSSWP